MKLISCEEIFNDKSKFDICTAKQFSKIFEYSEKFTWALGLVPYQLLYHRFLLDDDDIVGIAEYGVAINKKHECAVLLTQVDMCIEGIALLNAELQQFGVPIVGFARDKEQANYLVNNINNITIEMIK